jgi:phosphoserine aminotransferase
VSLHHNATAARERNLAKAGLLYDAIAASGGFYHSPVAVDSRSAMNVPFTIPSNPDLEKTFVAGEWALRVVDVMAVCV